ncbi:hypothetical protein Tco_0313375 [Tanacetum coccineum]
MFFCFLSQEEPKRVAKALSDSSWVEAMQEELLQFKLQKVGFLTSNGRQRRRSHFKYQFYQRTDTDILKLSWRKTKASNFKFSAATILRVIWICFTNVVVTMAGSNMLRCRIMLRCIFRAKGRIFGQRIIKGKVALIDREDELPLAERMIERNFRSSQDENEIAKLLARHNTESSRDATKKKVTTTETLDEE